MKTNDAEYLVSIINGKRHFEGKPLTDSTMVWKCSVVGCTTPPKPQRRGQYQDKFKCNSCSNKEKSKNPEILKKRGKAISKAIADLGNKWSEVAIKNMANEESRNKISKSVKEYIEQNYAESTRIRRETALRNNEITGFGTSEFSKKIWETLSKEDRIEIGSKISTSLKKEGKDEHLQLLNQRFPDFKLVQFGNPDNLYECSKNHIFPMRGNNFIKRGNCPVCTPRSKIELDTYNWFSNLVPEAKRNKRVLYLDETNNGNRALEIDIYDDNKKLGIEVHGLFVHQEDMVGEKHKIKAELAEKHGITLYQFFEDEIVEKFDIIQSMIKNKYGLTSNIVRANKCEIKEVPSAESSNFIDENHLQGNCKSFYRIGIYNNNKLISILTFRKYEDGVAEIARFCTLKDYTVSGGFARLLKRAENHLKCMGYKELITYSDRRYSAGDIYLKNGFSFISNTVSDFFWFKNGIRYSRQISWGKTKAQMLEDKYRVILGAGHKKFYKYL